MTRFTGSREIMVDSGIASLAIQVQLLVIKWSVQKPVVAMLHE